MSRDRFARRQSDTLAPLKISYRERVVFVDLNFPGNRHRQLNQRPRQTTVDFLGALGRRCARRIEQQRPIHRSLRWHGPKTKKVGEDRDRVGLVIDLVLLANLTMAVTVRRIGELERDEHVLRTK